VHRASWPDAAPWAADSDRRILAVTSEALRQIRRAKSTARLSMRADDALAEVSAPPGEWELLGRAEADLRSAGRIGTLAFRPVDAGPITVTCTF
jgi:valyl-tRNA synthetase